MRKKPQHRPFDIPTVEEMQRDMKYDPETGFITWLHREEKTRYQVAWNKKYAGKIANSKGPYGYLTISYKLRPRAYHRVCWALHYGEWPSQTIDHINLDKTDNRICNLRLALHRENSRNKPLYKNNTSGFKGVMRNKNENKWYAEVWLNYKRFRIYGLNTPEEAAAEYDRLATELHGEFSRTNELIRQQQGQQK